MKKILIICLTVILSLAAVCFVSCSERADDKLREINVALMQDYSKVELKVVTHTDEADLNAKYVMEKNGSITNISYEVERLNGFDANGNAPSEFITTVTGSATFNGNAITSIDGDAEMVNFDLVDANMAFRLSYFEEMKVRSDGIFANVANTKKFMQNDDFEGTDMTVDVKMADGSLSDILIVYNLDGAEITLNYNFTR